MKWKKRRKHIKKKGTGGMGREGEQVKESRNK